MALKVGSGSKVGCFSPSTNGLLVSQCESVSVLCMSKPLAFRLSNLSKSFINLPLSSPLWTEEVSSSKSNWRVSNYNTRAEANGNDGAKNQARWLAPLVPESTTGQFFMSMLGSHPHLFSAAVDQQLEKLAAERDAAKAPKQERGSGIDATLYRKIGAIRAKERRQTVEEIMYASIVQKFVKAGVTLVPKFPSLSYNDKQIVALAALQKEELETVHSAEALEMVREHLQRVLGERGSRFHDQHNFANVSKACAAEDYALSVMYGYLLRRVDERFQLEKSMKGSMLDAKTSFQMTEDDRPIESVAHNLTTEATTAIADLFAAEEVSENMGANGAHGSHQADMKSSRLRSYVMSFDRAFDPEPLQIWGEMRAKESFYVVKRHVEALFGKPEILIGADGTLRMAFNDEMWVSFSALRRLVLEAVAFGSFLSDVESTVDCQYSMMVENEFD